jgi:hypothetical protein
MLYLGASYVEGLGRSNRTAPLKLGGRVVSCGCGTAYRCQERFGNESSAGVQLRQLRKYTKDISGKAPETYEKLHLGNFLVHILHAEQWVSN